MKRDRLFRDSAPKDSGFKFDAKVAAVFNDMITRSVPFYVEQQRMVAEIVRQHWQPGTNIYDLGCATVKLSRSPKKLRKAKGKLNGSESMCRT